MWQDAVGCLPVGVFDPACGSAVWRITKILYRKFEIYSQKRNCAATVPFPTFIFLCAICLFPRSVRIFCCRKIGGPITGIYKSLTKCGYWGLRQLSSFSGNTYCKSKFLCSASRALSLHGPPSGQSTSDFILNISWAFLTKIVWRIYPHTVKGFPFLLALYVTV